MGKGKITAAVVRKAIRGVKYPENRPDSSLLNSELVQTRLREEGRPTSYRAKWMALKLILEEIVRAERRRLREKPSQSEPTEGEAWDALYYWCFAPERLAQKEIGEKLGLNKRTVGRRIGLSYKLLASVIQSRERDLALPLYPPLGRAQKAKGTREAPSYGDIPPTEAEKREQADRALAGLARAIREKGAPPQLNRDSLEALHLHPAETLEEYLLQRIAAWQQRSLSLDQRFVNLSLWLDTAGEPGVTPATKSPQRFSSLEEALIELPDRLLVVIGEPGAGKTTLLEYLEHETAVSSVLGMGGGSIPFLVRLKTLSQLPKEQPAVLRLWLQRQWARRNPKLPSLPTLIEEGRLLLLLDGLNEVSHYDRKAYAAYARQWRSCAEEILTMHPGNRIVFSCRTLDYTTPLSSRERRVPRLEILPLDETGIRQFLEAHLLEQAGAIWDEIAEKSLARVVRVPLVLKHLVKIVEARGELPAGLSGIFTAFVRASLKHELEWGNPLFDSAGVLAAPPDVN